ncbi:hypothetical protein R3X25_08465 [Lutibacter sp. TH_r2]|uniref:hypothetical protein n=1 Tax=Lutibacter sp. TH_r2 TaxID=3082083 RepID=UPI0029534010|nr:hypothetical protein [Lutibacter sp. TH_r2]MDV7187310.1 hypothetical protein [Lutibacter sp. TH_r2]
MPDNLKHIFEKFENQFDIEEPRIGHFKRFEEKLNPVKPQHFTIKTLFARIAAAASIILMVGIWIGSNLNSTNGMELAQVSNEMEETQSYFVATIEKELQTIKTEQNSDTEQLINDALNQLNKLENQYHILTLELKESAEDKRIIYAMISNFQQRIELLQTLMQQIENVKQLKTQNNETYI